MNGEIPEIVIHQSIAIMIMIHDWYRFPGFLGFRRMSEKNVFMIQWTTFRFQKDSVML